MKVLITGATGLVGSEIVRLCKQRGIPVHYLTTRKGKLEHSEEEKGFLWNPSDGRIDDKCLEGVTRIIHLAGASIAQRWTPKAKEEILRSRVNATKLLVELLKQNPGHQVKQIVSASAIGVYPSSLTALYEETEQGVDDAFPAKVVAQWERTVDEFKTAGIMVTKVRTGLVLSSNGGALTEIAKPIKRGVGAVLGSGDQWQSWIHITDLASIFLLLIQEQFEGIFNAVAPNPVTHKKMTKTIAEILERPLWLPNVPSFMLKLMFGEMSHMLLSSQRVSSKKLQEHGFDFQFVNLTAALQDLLPQK